MPTPKLSEGKIAQITDLLRQKPALTNKQIAKIAKVAVGTVSNVDRKYRRTGGAGGKELPGEVNVPVKDMRDSTGVASIVTPDKPLTLAEMYTLFEIDPKVWKATTFTANQWHGFYKATTVTTANGRNSRKDVTPGKVALWQTKATFQRIMGESIQLALLDFFREHVRPLPKPKLNLSKTGKVGEGHMVSWGLWDAHLGLYAWQSEVGESMDLTKGVARVCNSIDDMATKLTRWPCPIEKIVMPIGNDFLHYDNLQQHTTHGDHHLDADGRYAKVYAAGLRCLIYMVERALELCEDVEILYVPGNHDLTSSYTLCVALAQRFINDPRVKFDLRANPRKYIQFGGTLLGFDHGQGANAKQLSLIFSSECKDQWSNTSYREIQVGHVHQRRVTEFESVIPTNGVTIRTNPCLSAVDTWHHTQGLIGEPVKSVEAWMYSRTAYEGSLVTWARDDESAALAKVKLTR